MASGSGGRTVRGGDGMYGVRRWRAKKVLRGENAAIRHAVLAMLAFSLPVLSTLLCSAKLKLKVF
jgi:hypothetical protein